LQKLKAYIYYESDDLAATKAHVEKCIQDDPDIIVLQGCIHYKEGNYEAAKKSFNEALIVLGYRPHIAYNVALCSYRLKQYSASLKVMQEIIEKGIREHPELSVGSVNEGYEVRSVGNSQTLRDTSLIEAFNLKCAIMYTMKNCKYVVLSVYVCVIISNILIS
jgi:tetratricopeptide repeat protein 30